MANELMWALEGLGREYTAALGPKGRFACKEPTRCVFFDFFLEVSIIFPIFAGEYTLFKKSTI
jgi:hypothetical protein